MTDKEIIVLPRSLIEKIHQEAETLGVSLDELIIERLTSGLDPKERAEKYIEAALLFLERAKRELEEGDLKQASEKLWGAAAPAIKAYAYWKDGKRLASYRDLWEYKDKVVIELGKWVRSAWNVANSMHTNFYEGWATRKDVEDAFTEIERLIKVISERLRRCRSNIKKEG